MKESVLGVGLSIPPLQSDGGALVLYPEGLAALLTNLFNLLFIISIYSSSGMLTIQLVLIVKHSFYDEKTFLTHSTIKLNL